MDEVNVSSVFSTNKLGLNLITDIEEFDMDVCMTENDVKCIIEFIEHFCKDIGGMTIHKNSLLPKSLKFSIGDCYNNLFFRGNCLSIPVIEFPEQFRGNGLLDKYLTGLVQTIKENNLDVKIIMFENVKNKSLIKHLGSVGFKEIYLNYPKSMGLPEMYKVI